MRCLVAITQALLFALSVLGPWGALHAEVTLEENEYVIFQHHGMLGSPVAATDAVGNVLWYENTQPYEKTLGRRALDGLGHGADPFNEDEGRSRIGYTGHVRDGASGLIYMQARHYDPELGRFLSNDPVGFSAENPMSFNRYAYANNSPYRYVDPDGRNAVTAIGGFFYESAEGAFGIGDGRANYGNLGGALADGYNGQGSGFLSAAGQDALEIGGAFTGGAFAGKIASKIAGFFRKSPSKRVGRHMSPDELDKMRSSGRVQEGGGGQTRVADPADPNAYRNAPEGDVYVEFDVPADRVLPHSQGTGRIPGPNSPDARVPGRNSSDYEMPSADNIEVP